MPRVAGGKADAHEKHNRSGRFDRVTSFIFVSVLVFPSFTNESMALYSALHEQSGNIFSCYPCGKETSQRCVNGMGGAAVGQVGLGRTRSASSYRIEARRKQRGNLSLCRANQFLRGRSARTLNNRTAVCTVTSIRARSLYSPLLSNYVCGIRTLIDLSFHGKVI